MVKNYYTEKQLAEELGIGVRTVYEWRKHYGLKGIKAGTQWLHSTEQINDFFKRQAGKDVSSSKIKR